MDLFTDTCCVLVSLWPLALRVTRHRFVSNPELDAESAKTRSWLLSLCNAADANK